MSNTNTMINTCNPRFHLQYFAERGSCGKQCAQPTVLCQSFNKATYTAGINVLNAPTMNASTP